MSRDLSENNFCSCANNNDDVSFLLRVIRDIQLPFFELHISDYQTYYNCLTRTLSVGTSYPLHTTAELIANKQRA